MGWQEAPLRNFLSPKRHETGVVQHPPLRGKRASSGTFSNRVSDTLLVLVQCLSYTVYLATDIAILLDLGGICKSDMRCALCLRFRDLRLRGYRIRTGDRGSINSTLACKEQCGQVLFFDVFHGYLSSTLVYLGTSTLHEEEMSILTFLKFWAFLAPLCQGLM